MHVQYNTRGSSGAVVQTKKSLQETVYIPATTFFHCVVVGVASVFHKTGLPYNPCNFLVSCLVAFSFISWKSKSLPHSRFKT